MCLKNYYTLHLGSLIVLLFLFIIHFYIYFICCLSGVSLFKCET